MYAYIQFSHSVMSDSLRPHGLQHNRLPCLSPSPRACSNSCPLSQCCLPTISSSVTPFSCCLPSFPASGSFPVSWLFTSGGQRTGASASASVTGKNHSATISSGLPWRLRQERICLQCGDRGLIPGSRRSPGDGNGNPLQYSCQGHSMGRGAWWARVHGVAKETWPRN